MKKLIFLSLLLLSACGGSGGNECTFSFGAITNGSTGAEISSRWECAGEGEFGTFALFSDGTGAAIIAGQFELDAFTWTETGCNSLSYDGFDIVSGIGFSGEVTDLVGSRSQGTLTFVLDEDDMPPRNVACTLI